MAKDPSSKRVWSDVHKVPYLVLGSTWVGYDDQQSFANKVGKL